MADTNHPVGTVIGDETYAAQDTAGAAFLQSLPPGYIDLPLDQQKPIVAALAKLIAELSGRIITSHVLPWEAVILNPTGGEGLDRPMPAVCQQFDDTGDHIALWLKTGPLPTDWAIFEGSTDDHEVKADSADAGHGALIDKIKAGTGMSLSVIEEGGIRKVLYTCTLEVPVKSTTLPLPDGDEAVLGDENKWADGKHVHPKVRPTKIRYYLSDTHGTGEWTGHLLLTENPYTEGTAVDLSVAAHLMEFVSSPGSPGLAVWTGGTAHAHLRLKLTGARVGRTYKLYNGDHSIVYTSLIKDYNGNWYQTEPFPAQPTVTESYVDLDFDIPVASLSAGTDHRFNAQLVLRAYVGDEEDGLDGEELVVRVGGDNASYFDTLFTPDGSFSGVHNDLDGREARNCHPQASIEPGLILGNMGATVATVDGLLTLPPKTNAVRITGEETLLGISTDGITAGTVIYVSFGSSRLVRNGGDPGTGFECLSFLNLFGTGAQPFYLLAPINGAVTLKLSGGGVWTVLSAPWVEIQRPLWPAVANLTINTTTAPGLLELPVGCPEVIYVTGTELRAITVLIEDGGNAVAGPQGALKLIFANDCTLYHDDPLSGWDAGLAARAAKLDLLPPADVEGSARDMWVGGKRAVRFWRDWSGDDPLWVREVAQ